MATPRERAANVAAARAAGGTNAIAQTDQRVNQAVAGALSQTAQTAATAAILAALVRFYVRQQQAAVAWMTPRLARPGVTADDITRVLGEEQQRERDFAAKQTARLAGRLAIALREPDRARREQLVRGIMAREQQYARQRSEAQAVRAFAAVDRVVLRTESPAGAFWRLDPTVKEHTPGCLKLGGKFWPWQVLDRVHPPRHAGCPCRLLGFSEAVAEGLMRPQDVQDVAKAVAAAAAVVMEGVLVLDDPRDALGLLSEAGVLDHETAEMMLRRYGLREAFTEDKHPRDRKGEFTAARFGEVLGSVKHGAVSIENVKAGGFGERFVAKGEIHMAGKKIGNVSRFYDPKTKTLVKELTNVDQAHQRKGIAAGLARAEERAMAAAGVERVEVVPGSDAGRALATHLGFTEVVPDTHGQRLRKTLAPAPAAFAPAGFHGTSAHPDEVLSAGLVPGGDAEALGSNMGTGVYLGRTRGPAETYVTQGGFIYAAQTDGLLSKVDVDAGEVAVRGTIPPSHLRIVPVTKVDAGVAVRDALKPALEKTGVGKALLKRMERPISDLVVDEPEVRVMLAAVRPFVNDESKRWAWRMERELRLWQQALAKHRGSVLTGLTAGAGTLTG